MTTPAAPPNTPVNAHDIPYEQPRTNPMKKKKAFTFDVDFLPPDKRHQKLTEDQLKEIREKFLSKGNK